MPAIARVAAALLITTAGVATSFALAAPIPVFGTGFNANGTRAADGTIDGHWVITQRPGPGDAKPDPAYVVTNRADGAWLNNTGAAKWISHAANQSITPTPDCLPAGNYTYRTTFDLTGLDPSTAVIQGRWAADNTGIALLFNNTAVAVAAPSFSTFEQFTLNQGFVAGVNTLDLRVNDGGCPTGIIVELSGTATPQVAQSILIGPLPDRGVGGASFTLTGFATSGLPVTYASTTPGSCAVANSFVTIRDVGTCTITADQPGDANFLAAPQVTRSFNVAARQDPRDVRVLAAGAFHTCAITDDGATWCWGASQRVGNGTGDVVTAPTMLANLPAAVALAANEHTCMLTAGGGIKCWGLNAQGALGDGTTTTRLAPVDVSGIAASARAIAAGGRHSCAIAGNGNVNCWGWNFAGQLGDGTKTDRLERRDLLLSGVSALEAGLFHTCALTTAGTVKCWGTGGRTGDGTNTERLTPVDVAGLSDVRSIAAGDGHTCALTTAGTVRCWGDNSSGQLGDGTTTSRPAPVDVPGLSGVVAVSAGDFHTCALLSDGTARCWGNNGSGRLGDGTTVSRLSPVPVANLAGAVALSGGVFHTCAIVANGGIRCWGDNLNGQLGLGSFTLQQLTPVTAAVLSGVDARPDPLPFATRHDVVPGSLQVSDRLAPTGFFDAAPISVAGGEYSIDCGPFFTRAAGTIFPGNSVCVRHEAATGYLSQQTTTLTIGGVASTFSSVTMTPPALLITPDRLDFAPRAVGTTSAPLTAMVTNTGIAQVVGLRWGTEADFAVSSSTCAGVLDPGASCMIEVTFTPYAAGARAGELLVLGSANVPVMAALPLGGAGLASDTTPNAFSFADQFLVPVNSVVTSAPVRLTGLTGSAPASVVGGTYAVSSGNNCAGDVAPFTANPGLVANDQYVCVRHTSSAVPGGSNDTQLVVGGLGDTFTTVTADPVPAPFAIAAQGGVGLSTPRVSTAVAITGINTASPFTVANGQVSVNCSGVFVTSGTLDPGSSLCARHTSGAGFGQATTTTVTVGGVSAEFVSTTFAAAGDADNDGIPNAVEYNETRNPEAKDNDIFGSARLFAMQQYRDFLGREGDAGGIQFYMDLLTSGAAERANVIEGFFSSPEFSGSVSPIVRLYFATFLRVPDYEGLLFQVDAYRSGAPLAGIATNFTLSPEFTALYGNTTDAQYVQLLYTNILGRTASPGEVDFHVARLQAGASRGDVLVGFSESPEYQQRSYNRVYVTMMYVGMLRRAPEPAGFDYWVNYMDTGSPGLALILGFLQAPEYRNRFLP